MKKIETSVSAVKDDIRKFYNPELQHFMVMNAVDNEDSMEIQWFFCDYAAPCAITCFFTKIEPSVLIPSICDIISSAWVAESELVDLMDITIENTAKGFVLEPDSDNGPLRKKK